MWHYSRTYVSEDLARAASALADELEKDRLKLTNAFGVSFAFDLPSAELPGDEEVQDWMSGHMRMSLFDWVLLNRRDLQIHGLNPGEGSPRLVFGFYSREGVYRYA